MRLLAPVRFYVTQQHGLGDRYVHGARSRFLTERVLQNFQRVTGPDDRAGAVVHGATASRLTRRLAPTEEPAPEREQMPDEAVV